MLRTFTVKNYTGPEIRRNESLAKDVREWGGMTPLERFMFRVEKTDSCWNWTGRVSRGYSVFTIGKLTILGHRYIYRHFKGDIPDGLTIDHLCKNKLCVNPDHLEPVTMRENLARSNSISSVNRAKTHCPNNHPYDDRNTLFAKDGSRICKECAYKRHREWSKRRNLLRGAILRP